MNVTLNANRGWYAVDYELRAGVIDDDARWVFTSGHCHSLALALHEETGWDLVGGGYDRTPEHVAVRTPFGRVLDIEGLHAASDWAEQWGAITDVDPDDAYGAFYGDYREPEVDKARHWVKSVLRAYVPLNRRPAGYR